MCGNIDRSDGKCPGLCLGRRGSAPILGTVVKRQGVVLLSVTNMGPERNQLPQMPPVLIITMILKAKKYIYVCVCVHVIYIIYYVKYLKTLLWLSPSYLEASENLIKSHKGRKHRGHHIKAPTQKRNCMISITTDFS